MTAKNSICVRCDCLKKFSHGLITKLEIFFYKLGALVSRNPWITIGLCVLVCGLMGTGLIKWNEEKGYMENWVPHESRVVKERKWISENFPESVRVEGLIIEDENVLTPQVINAIFDVYKSALNLEIPTGDYITQFCVETCRVNSILDLWSYNESIIRNLSQEEIVRAVNQRKIISSVFKTEIDMKDILGNIQKSDEGKITGAQATTMFWFLQVNETIKPSVMEWEKELIDLVNNKSHNNLQNVYIFTPRTYDDEAVGTLFKDVKLLTFGFCLVFIYLSLSIGKFSFVHHKVLLACAGLLSIGMSIAFTYGFGFYSGIMFGTVHLGMPFLLLGVGVDDIFVIMESYNHLTAAEKALPLESRLAYTMKHAGVSITVTSVTDIVAFAIGGSTVIPALSTFCIYAAIGILALYVLQATFFVACLALDERRQDSLRNACIVCYKHPDTYKPNKYYTFSIQQTVMNKVWAPALTKTPVKVIVVLLTVGITSINTWTFCTMPHQYDPMAYLPKNSYAKGYLAAVKKFFPSDGAFVELYCGEGDYAAKSGQLIDLYEKIRERHTVQANTVDFWLASFQRWLSTNPHQRSLQNHSAYSTSQINPCLPELSLQTVEATKNYLKNAQGRSSKELKSKRSYYKTLDPTRETRLHKESEQSGTSGSEYLLHYNLSDLQSKPCEFLILLLQFLTTQEGQGYFKAIQFDNITAPTHIVASTLTFRHVICESSECSIEAMDDMRELVDNFSFKGRGTCFVYSNPEYIYNETNKVIKIELYRNLGFAAVTVFIVTLLLITNVRTSLLVFICVVITVVDVAGMLNLWNVTIDTCVGVLLILCFGLAVDFSAHIGHSFMVNKGTRNERSEKTLVTIGPAVFSGGFSTYLAISLLCLSSSYAFIMFFRIFTLVVVFGLFHGLVFLPVLLSIMGPPPYETKLSPDNIKFTKQNDDKQEVTLPNGGTDIGEFKDPPLPKEGSLASTESVSIGSLLDQYKPEIHQQVGDKDPRYSGSYYEQMSSGSWAEISPLET